MNSKGKAFKYGNNIDTDVIIPARYLNITDVKELATYCMIDIDKDFMKNVKPGDVIVAENNFGCGTSREHAPLVIKESGISCIIAKNYARIFYRNCFNIGLPILECEEAADKIQAGNEVSVDFEKGIITNITRNETYQAQPFPDFIRDLIECGGLVGYVKKKIDK